MAKKKSDLAYDFGKRFFLSFYFFWYEFEDHVVRYPQWKGRSGIPLLWLSYLRS